MTNQPSQIAELLRKSWEGEILGESFFEGLAKALPDDRREWEALARLERVTGRLVEAVAKAHGVEVDEAEAARTGAAFAESATEESRDDLLKATIGLANDEFLPLYRQIAGVPGEDESTLGKALVAHELALIHCCEALLAGEPGGEDKIEEFIAVHPTD